MQLVRTFALSAVLVASTVTADKAVRRLDGGDYYYDYYYEEEHGGHHGDRPWWGGGAKPTPRPTRGWWGAAPVAPQERTSAPTETPTKEVRAQSCYGVRRNCRGGRDRG